MTQQERIYRAMLSGFSDVLDVREVSVALKVSTKTIYKHLNDGSLHSIKVGREFRVPKAHLIEFLCKKDKGV